MARRYIGTELRRLRRRLKRTQKGLAEVLNVHWRSIQDWEADRTAVDTYKATAILEQLKQLAKAKKGRKR